MATIDTWVRESSSAIATKRRASPVRSVFPFPRYVSYPFIGSMQPAQPSREGGAKDVRDTKDEPDSVFHQETAPPCVTHRHTHTTAHTSARDPLSQRVLA